MSPISRGFFGRRQRTEDPSRVPPGQYVTRDFPVLSAGPTPHTALDDWSFTISGQVDEPVSWTWTEFLALASDTPKVDIHCPTKWTKLETTCGPTGFVEAAAQSLVEQGQDPGRVRTERFGATGT